MPQVDKMLDRAARTAKPRRPEPSALMRAAKISSSGLDRNVHSRRSRQPGIHASIEQGLRRMFASDVTEDYVVEQGVTAKAVVIKDASRKLARSAQTRPGLASMTQWLKSTLRPPLQK